MEPANSRDRVAPGPGGVRRAVRILCSPHQGLHASLRHRRSARRGIGAGNHAGDLAQGVVVRSREQRGGTLEASDAALEFQIDETPQPDSRLAAEQSERRVHSALAQLPPDQVLVVELSFFEDKAHAEIAQTLGIPLGTVKSRLRLAMNRLRNLLGDVA